MQMKKEIRRIIEGILDGDPVPQEWCEASILPKHRRGNATIVSNYRGIAIGNTKQVPGRKITN